MADVDVTQLTAYSTPTGNDILIVIKAADDSLNNTTISELLSLVSVPSAYTSNPAALGTASPGSSTAWARGDHVHAKPTYSKSDVGLGNVDNVQQYSASNPPPAQVFMAEYGVTTSSDIDGCYLGGIFVRCRTVGGVDHALVYCDGNGYALFSCYDPDSDVISVLECDNDVWDSWTVTIPTTASDVGAVAVAQGVGHAGEFLVVGSDGDVTTVTLSTWQGGSY